MNVVYSEDCLLHNPPFEATRGEIKSYLECPARLKSIKNFIDSQPNQFTVVGPNDYSLTPILNVHEDDYIEFLHSIYNTWVAEGMPPEVAIGEAFAHANIISKIKRDRVKKTSKLSATAQIGLHSFDMSIAYTKETWRSTYISAQIALTSAHKLLKQVAENKSESIYALCRPPGHHATCNVSGAGYCFINNAAVATRFLQDYTLEEMDAMSKPLTTFDAAASKKIMIVDIDHHHGNGTQDIFYDDPSVLYVSLHGYPDYPFFTGSIEETGEGEGEGYNINIPLNPQTTTDDIYLDNLKNVLEGPVAEKFGADIVVCSMGLDTWHEDPVAGMKGLKNVATYFEMGRLLKTSKSCTGRPVLFVQEGGYTIEKLGLLAGRVLQGYLA
ncbi:hypothetical protein BJV82DRAFT_527311 [Fennellomyces sp. T-0311]|nr:hypothetical protein BJV82DRAFT_527311 [Fennellomyces sp. T-0311]